MSHKSFSIEYKRAALLICIATDLWYLNNIPTKLKSGSYRVYQLIGAAIKVYEEMIVFSLYLFFVKVSFAWLRK